MSDSTDKLNDKAHECSHCDGSGIVYQHSDGGDVVNMPCPRCTEDVISHIRNWDWKGQMFDG